MYSLIWFKCVFNDKRWKNFKPNTKRDMEIEVHTDNILNRLKYSDEDVSIYANGSECQQYKPMPKNSPQQTGKTKEVTAERSNPTGYIICYAISICGAIISTGFISHHILKPHYDGCLTVSGLPDLPSKLLRPPRDCNGHFSNGALEDGVYRIYPEMTEPFHVYCDMTNGGWTVIQRRTSGDEDFDRTWTDYVRGFGNLTKDHWLGLQHLHLITRQERGYQISFEFLLKESDAMVKAVYENFYIGDQRTNFTLKVSFSDGYNSEMRKRIDEKHLFLYHDLAPFSTKDVDNDFWKESSCVEEMECGGFWYTYCTMLCINGDFNGMFFYGRAFKPVFIKTSSVKIRRSV